MRRFEAGSAFVMTCKWEKDRIELYPSERASIDLSKE
jgi:hypothetical protein